MSEQRKRLTDAEIAESRRLVKEAPERPILAEVALEMDHDQAREDRKQLMEALRARVDACCPPSVVEPCRACMLALRLLAEVGE